MSSPLTACPLCALEFSGGETFCAVDGARLVPRPSHGLGGSIGPDPLLNQTLASRYRILRKIGEGGMGIVYEAIHVVIEKSVALKVLREDFTHREDVVERFRQEAKSASRIGHENIIDISDFGVTPGGQNFFVMELLLGRDLAEELELRGPLPPRRAVAIVLQCAKALEAAHAKGIVHRDIKPENVFLVQRDTGEDFVKIVDFGIAKMSDVATGRAAPGRKVTGSGMIFGTPEYMSPEHAAGRALDHRVDIYALGIILYELLTGQPPFMGDTFMGILTLHMFEQAPPLRTTFPACSAPPELEQLVLRAIAKNPDERPQSMGAFALELSQLLPYLSSPASQPPPGTLTYLDQPPLRLPPEHAFSTPPSVTPPFQRELAPRPRSRSWVLPGSALLLAAGIVVAALLLRSHGLSTISAARARLLESRPPPPTPAALVTRAPTPPAASADLRDARQQAESGPVAVSVVSHPEGATVSVDGVKACPATPCQFQARAGTAVHLVVQLAGYHSSRSDYTPKGDHDRLDLTLSPRRGGAPSGTTMKGDLMLPDAFGKR
ncbi:MAG: serine/threonine protein kinase [Myxococcaceae bacterium]|nr:serine/threonine protein kinase [Myxococcaceae bacterium]